MRSVSLLVYKAVDGAIEVGYVGRPVSPFCKTAVPNAQTILKIHHRVCRSHNAVATLALPNRRSRETSTQTG